MSDAKSQQQGRERIARVFRYLKALNELIDRYKRELGAVGIDYQLLTTDQPLELGLLAYLSTRGHTA